MREGGFVFLYEVVNLKFVRIVIGCVLLMLFINDFLFVIMYEYIDIVSYLS